MLRSLYLLRFVEGSKHSWLITYSIKLSCEELGTQFEVPADAEDHLKPAVIFDVIYWHWSLKSLAWQILISM